jgi:Tfp pilus assembly protein PilO
MKRDRLPKRLSLRLPPRWSPGRLRFDLREDLWRIAAVLGALLLLNLGFYVLLNRPRLQALADLTAGRDAVRQELAARSGDCRAMSDLIARYDDESAKLRDFFERRLGTQIETMTSIQKEIREIAMQFRIDPESIDYRPAKMEGTDLTRFQITIPLVGGYPNLRHFINKLESSDRLFIIDSVELTGARGGGAAMLSLTIRISTFFRAPQAPEDRVAARGPQ